MEVLREVAGLIDEHTELGRRYGLGQLLEEFRRSLHGRAGLPTGGRQPHHHRRDARGQRADRRPRVRTRDFTTSRVLTMEFVPGRKVTDIGPLGRLDIDGAPLADELFRVYLHHVLVDGIFHADPHPGNVLVTDDGRLVLLDIGMVARIPPAYREKLLKLLLALADARPDDVVRAARTMGEELPDYDEATFRAHRQPRARASRRRQPGGPRSRHAPAPADPGGRRARAPDGPRAHDAGEGRPQPRPGGDDLDPEFEPLAALKRHAAEIMQTSMRSSPAALLASVLEAKEFAEALPGRVNRAFDAIGEGHFEMRIRAFDEAEFLRGLHKLANVIAAGLVLSSMILASAILANTSDRDSTQSRIALVTFVVAVLIALTMLGRIVWQSRKLRMRD